MVFPLRRFLSDFLVRLAISAGFTLCTFPIGVLQTRSDSIQTYKAKPVIVTQVKRKQMIGLPQQLTIPTINLFAPILSMGLLPDGKLNVPQNQTHAGWYALGPKPGEAGTAVIDGHLNVPGAPGIFHNLNKLKKGDTIYVTDMNGRQKSFRVTDMQYYQVEQAPLNRIFGVNSIGTHLNLITCAGVWRKKYGHYDKRLVIYTDAVSEEVLAKNL